MSDPRRDHVLHGQKVQGADTFRRDPRLEGSLDTKYHIRLVSNYTTVTLGIKTHTGRSLSFFFLNYSSDLRRSLTSSCCSLHGYDYGRSFLFLRYFSDRRCHFD